MPALVCRRYVILPLLLVMFAPTTAVAQQPDDEEWVSPLDPGLGACEVLTILTEESCPAAMERWGFSTEQSLLMTGLVERAMATPDYDTQDYGAIISDVQEEANEVIGYVTYQLDNTLGYVNQQVDNIRRAADDAVRTAQDIANETLGYVLWQVGEVQRQVGELVAYTYTLVMQTAAWAQAEAFNAIDTVVSQVNSLIGFVQNELENAVYMINRAVEGLQRQVEDALNTIDGLKKAVVDYVLWWWGCLYPPTPENIGSCLYAPAPLDIVPTYDNAGGCPPGGCGSGLSWLDSPPCERQDASRWFSGRFHIAKPAVRSKGDYRYRVINGVGSGGPFGGRLLTLMGMGIKTKPYWFNADPKDVETVHDPRERTIGINVSAQYAGTGGEFGISYTTHYDPGFEGGFVGPGLRTYYHGWANEEGTPAPKGTDGLSVWQIPKGDAFNWDPLCGTMTKRV